MNTRGSGSALNEKWALRIEMLVATSGAWIASEVPAAGLIAIDHFVIAITSAGAVVRHNTPMRRG